MKNNIPFWFFIILTSIPGINWADKTRCEQLKAIHCSYYEGNQSEENGKYIKVTYNNSISHIHCTRGGFFDFSPQPIDKLKKDLAGKEIVTYEQCFDPTCKESRKLGTDIYTIIKKNQKYTSRPYSFHIHLINEYGKSCATWK